MGYPPAEHVLTREKVLDELRVRVVVELEKVLDFQATVGTHAVMMGDIEHLEGEKTAYTTVLHLLAEMRRAEK